MGGRLIELANAKDWTIVKNELGTPNMARSRKLQVELRRDMSTPADAIVHENVGAVLVKSRPGCGQAVLDGVGGVKKTRRAPCDREGQLVWGALDDYDQLQDWERLCDRVERLMDPSAELKTYDEITETVGAELLPRTALEEKPSNNSDAIVNATLGGLTRRLVEFGDAQGARDSCAEWMGVASPSARLDAVSVYCKIWKYFGGELLMCDLSRNGRGHWRDGMLSGDGTLRGLANSHSTTAASLEQIGLSEQKKLKGGVLEILLEKGGPPKLRTLKVKNCSSAAQSGIVPASIGEYKSLVSLNLQGSGFHGALAQHPY